MAKVNIYWRGYDLYREVGQEEVEIYKGMEFIGRYNNISLAFDAIEEFMK